jgi:hypothetical protein
MSVNIDMIVHKNLQLSLILIIGSFQGKEPLGLY